MRFKVCILTAGKGSRMGEFSQLTNKSLLPLDDKAVISWIIERFPNAEEFVIAVGFRSEDVRTYLKLAHPHTQFRFVDVDPYQGAGSGPGYSLWCCREQLNMPFYLVCADTLWSSDLPLPREENWVGVAPVAAGQSQHYCMVKVQDNRVSEVHDKEILPQPNAYKAFIGLFFIFDFKNYFAGLQLKKKINNEYQLSEGLSFLKDRGELLAKDIEGWVDLGTEEKYLAAIEKTGRLRKTSEIFYKVGDRVIKFYSDVGIANDRVKRSKIFPRIFPQIIGHEGGFYAYQFMPGINLYQRNTPALFSKLLNWLERELWQRQTEPANFAKICRDFFEVQTRARLDEFLQRNPSLKGSTRINGVITPPIEDQWNSLDWPELNRGSATIIHGDLQFGNILYDEHADTFRLVDWRQSFAGELAVGDIHYDFAKLLSGYILDLDQLGFGKFSLQETVDGVQMTHPPVKNVEAYDKILRDYFNKAGFSYEKVRTLAGLIFLRMSALHPAPMDRFLFYMGRSFLNHEA